MACQAPGMSLALSWYELALDDQSDWQVEVSAMSSPFAIFRPVKPLDLQLSCSQFGTQIGRFSMVPFATSLYLRGVHYCTALLLRTE